MKTLWPDWVEGEQRAYAFWGDDKMDWLERSLWMMFVSGILFGALLGFPLGAYMHQKAHDLRLHWTHEEEETPHR